jgi:pimeloyl-ACP methyl ester carboxylesterase
MAAMEKRDRHATIQVPLEFTTSDIASNGTAIHVRSGGSGPAALLLHRYGETADMWAPMAVDLARDQRVVVLDLRGMGLPAKPARGFDKKTQKADMAGVLDVLKIERAQFVTHDIGNMVGYAFAAQYPHRVTWSRSWRARARTFCPTATIAFVEDGQQFLPGIQAMSAPGHTATPSICSAPTTRR